MKGERCFVLREASVRDRAQAFVGDCPLTDQPLEVIVRPHRDQRSRDQNALYWSWLHVIGDELGYSAEEVHEALKKLYLPTHFVELGKGAAFIVASSTARLPVGDFAAYMDKVSAWATNQGIRLPA